MFLVMRNTTVRETELLGAAMRSVSSLLPASWALRTEAADRGELLRADALAVLTGPDGTAMRFAVESKVSGVSVGVLLPRLREMAAQFDLPILFVSDYVGPSLREALAAEGFSYADATGWVRVSTTSPLILLTGRGADRSPRARESTAVARLDGSAAGRIVRALCAVELPIGVRALADRAGVSPGSVSKVLPTLAREGVLDRDERGAVTVVRRQALIRRWVQDYTFLGTNPSPRHFIAPRGLDRTLNRVADHERPATLTGSAAARRYLPDGATSCRAAAPARALQRRPRGARRRAAADPRRARGGERRDRRALRMLVCWTCFSRPAALVLADLLTLPGRADAEAEQLADALALTEPAWKD
jgi:DNA-binding transcriptional ArsR family regulator